MSSQIRTKGCTKTACDRVVGLSGERAATKPETSNIKKDNKLFHRKMGVKFDGLGDVGSGIGLFDSLPMGSY